MEIKRNDNLILDITDLGINGEGIAHIDDKTVFVPYALPDEKVDCTIIFDNKMLIAKVNNILVKSKYRVQPKCPYFTHCGGCELQHLQYDQTLLFKSQIVKNTLHKVGGIDSLVDECVPSVPYRYRNKVALPIQQVGDHAIIGMYRKNSHKMVEIDDCMLQIDFVRPLIKCVKQFIEKYNLSGFNEQTKKGLLRHIVARDVNGCVLVTLVVTNKNIDGLDYFGDILQSAFGSYGLNLCINTKPDNAILTDNIIFVSGVKELNVVECGINYTINSLSFMQVNDQIKTLIYDKVLSSIDEGAFVIDAYSGAGLLSAIVSKKAQSVVGIEIIKQAVQNANDLCTSNKITNVTNKLGDCKELLPILLKQNKCKTNVILDPPRKGVDEQVTRALIDNVVDKIIYISCSPSTLARDLKLLVPTYDIISVSPFDMFANTKHVETVVVLKRK